ncbi:Polysaccharide biosynthesis protein [Bifidobacterium ramosum]|uniref:Oligosaccharide flippase family protein n=1 Tax=Bifidobacterium ramosum TaxID=1798158 RepID=A0A6L4X0E5_9BIFI|nr:oligosaccharide flippase family protein [Bifidobacterium ramosum]KAB8288017.1 Polysaccharide biosynthesis protein [Bifidobacterium ramosum]NEG72074.1 oligosaccharide flippase family protein [Bifidobacterium ramosum]
MVSQRKVGAILGYVNVIAKNLVNLLYTPLLLHFIGKGDYGVFQMTNSTVVSLSLLSMGFTSAYVRFYSRRKARNDEAGIRRLNGMYLIVFLTIMLICLLCGVFLWANTETLFSKGLTSGEIELAKTLILIMVLNLSLSFPASVFDSYIMVHERFVFQQSRQLFSTLAIPCVAITLLICGFGAAGVAFAWLIVSTVLLLLNIRYAIQSLHMRFSFGRFDWALFKAIGIFSFWIFLNQIFDLVNNNVPNFLLGAMTGSGAVAVFAIAVQIRNIFFMLSTTMSNVFIPKINRMVATENNNRKLTELMTRVGRYQMILFCFVYGGFALVGQYFIRIWAGESFGDAYWMILIMTLPVAIPLTQNTGIEIQRAKNRHKMRSLIYILTSVIDIIISIVFIPSFGYWATTWGYVASIVLGTGLFMNWYYHYRIGLDMTYFWTHMLPIIAVCAGVLAVSGLISYLTQIHGLVGFLLYGALYCALYVLAIWLFITTSDERRVLTGKLSVGKHPAHAR